MQTTFLNAFRGLQRGVVPEAESAWLFKIAENVCLTRRRSSWRRGRVESPSDIQALQDFLPARERERERDELIPLGDALAGMPEGQRRAILLREWQGLSYSEIATEMDVSQSAVETLIFRARRSLANALETPWGERVEDGGRARQAGRRAFDLSSVLAALKTLLAGGAAAKVAAVAVVATGTAAVAVADHRHYTPVRDETARPAAARAPQAVPDRPMVVAATPSAFDTSQTQPAPSGGKGKAKLPSGPGSPPASGQNEAHPAQPPNAATAHTPPGQAKEPAARANPPGHAQPKDEPRPKPKAQPKPKSRPRPAPKPKAQEPKPKDPPAAAAPAPAPDEPNDHGPKPKDKGD